MAVADPIQLSDGPRRRWLPWTIRVGAWLLAALALGRVAAQPTRMLLDGRLFQMHLRPEQPRAVAALTRSLGLERFIDFSRCRLVPGYKPTELSPVFLSVRPIAGPHADIRDYKWLAVMPDGRVLEPPLIYPDLAGSSWYETRPLPVWLPREDGTRQFAAIGSSQAYGPDCEWCVWVHRDGAWTNVLHFRANPQNRQFSAGALVPIPSAERADALRARIFHSVSRKSTWREFVLLWDKVAMTFHVPPDAEGWIEVLPPVQGNVWIPELSARLFDARKK